MVGGLAMSGEAMPLVLNLDDERLAARSTESERAYKEVLAGAKGSTYTAAKTATLDALVAMGRCSDIVVLGRPGADPENVAPATVEAALYECARAVMIAPPTAGSGQFNNVVVAWNGSFQAARAVVGRELTAAGFNLNFAPVLDVHTNPNNPVIGRRAISSDPKAVASLGRAVIRGLHDNSVVACGKHFPGHGDTHLDSHLDLPKLPHDLERLRKVELVPFRAYARANLASIMTAHVIFEALDPGVPATMSHKVLTGLLREELGFGGLIVSDDLEMRAVADHYDLPSAAVASLEAGCDLFLVCHRESVQRACIEAVARAVESGKIKRERFDQARARVQSLSMRFAQPVDPTLLAGLARPEHQKFAERVGKAGQLGFDPTERLA